MRAKVRETGEVVSVVRCGAFTYSCHQTGKTYDDLDLDFDFEDNSPHALGGLIKPTTCMNQYIRTQVVKAEPMTYGEAYKNGLNPENSYVKEYDDSLGYLIIHMDGFKNWSPKKIFDQEYKAVKGMTFGLAIIALKAGKKVRRKSWDCVGAFLWLKPATNVKAEWCKDPMLKDLAEKAGGEIPASDTICMFTAQRTVLTGWIPQQSDIFAEDWEVID